eukprot:SAG11_NODE_1664_length_4496_cov_1.786218_5_plen_473_part_00
MLMRETLRRSDAPYICYNQDDGIWRLPPTLLGTPVQSMYHYRLPESKCDLGCGMVSTIFRRATLKRFLRFMVVDHDVESDGHPLKELDPWKLKPIDWLLEEFVRANGYEWPATRNVQHVGEKSSLFFSADDRLSRRHSSGTPFKYFLHQQQQFWLAPTVEVSPPPQAREARRVYSCLRQNTETFPAILGQFRDQCEIFYRSVERPPLDSAAADNYVVVERANLAYVELSPSTVEDLQLRRVEHELTLIGCAAIAAALVIWNRRRVQRGLQPLGLCSTAICRSKEERVEAERRARTERRENQLVTKYKRELSLSGLGGTGLGYAPTAEPCKAEPARSIGTLVGMLGHEGGQPRGRSEIYCDGHASISAGRPPRPAAHPAADERLSGPSSLQEGGHRKGAGFTVRLPTEWRGSTPNLRGMELHGSKIVQLLPPPPSEGTTSLPASPGHRRRESCPEFESFANRVATGAAMSKVD